MWSAGGPPDCGFRIADRSVRDMPGSKRENRSRRTAGRRRKAAGKRQGTCGECLFRVLDCDLVHARYGKRKLRPSGGKGRDAGPADDRPPTPNPRLHRRKPTKPRCCRQCIHARRMRDGRRILWICANTTRSPGEIVRIRPAGRCPNFRYRRGAAVLVSPPKPPGKGARLIALSRGLFAVVDACDFERLNRHKWCALSAGHTCYAVRSENRRTILMHREIMHPPKGMVVDHIDGNGLFNRQSNLRVCTQAQNGYNRAPSRRRTSRFKGLYYCRRKRKWIAEIIFNKHKTHIGTFADEVEAARARDRKAVELHGVYAFLNFPDEWPPERRQAVYDQQKTRAEKPRKRKRNRKGPQRKTR